MLKLEDIRITYRQGENQLEKVKKNGETLRTIFVISRRPRMGVVRKCFKVRQKLTFKPLTILHMMSKNTREREWGEVERCARER